VREWVRVGVCMCVRVSAYINSNHSEHERLCVCVRVKDRVCLWERLCE